MSWSLNNVKAPDAYSNAATLDGLPAVRRARIDVQNQAIIMQVKQLSAVAAGPPGMSEGAATWGTEEYLAPGSLPLARAGLVGLRFRAAVPAAQLPVGALQAQVTVVVP